MTKEKLVEAARRVQREARIRHDDSGEFWIVPREALDDLVSLSLSHDGAPPEGSPRCLAGPRVLFAIGYAAFEPGRLARAEALRAALVAQGGATYSLGNTDERSPLSGQLQLVRQACLLAKEMGASHVCVLPDDVVLPLALDFVPAVARFVALYPHRVIDLLGNHGLAPIARDLGYDAYETWGGSLNFGGIMSVGRWTEYLDWRAKALRQPHLVPMDDGVNLWTTLHGERIVKPLPSPLQHDDGKAGRAGQDDALRVAHVVSADVTGCWKERHVRTCGLGRTFATQHRSAYERLKPEEMTEEAIARLAEMETAGPDRDVMLEFSRRMAKASR